MDLLIQIAQFILSISILVILHEAGHFFAAKFFKTKVEKFYLFFNPWFSLFKKKIGETEYGIGWLPLGGYVKIAGMIDESMDTEQMKSEPQPWEFRSKPGWQKLIIMLAGIFVNIVLAIIIYAGILMAWGKTTLDTSKVPHGYTFSKEAQTMGFQNGDNILSIDGESIASSNPQIKILLGNEATVVRNEEIVTFPINEQGKKDLMNANEDAMEPLAGINLPINVDSLTADGTAKDFLKKGDIINSINGETVYTGNLIKTIKENKNKDIAINFTREGQTQQAMVKVNAEGLIGIKPGIVEQDDMLSTEKYSLFKALKEAPSMAYNSLKMQVEQFKLVKVGMLKKVSGPLRMYKMFSPTWDWQKFWGFTAMFSIWLAFLNILPIPGLDGGHAIITIGEMITGRKMGEKIAEKVQMAGVIFLMSLMALVFGNDLFKIISGFFK